MSNYEPPEFLGRDLIPKNELGHQEPPYKGWIRVVKKILGGPKKLAHRIKWKWQKATRGWSDRDSWNLDYFYADLIERSLREYKENRMGSPELPKRDEDGNIVRDKEGWPVPVDNPHQVWDEKLEKMVWAFDKAKKVARGDLQFDDPGVFGERWNESYKTSVNIFGEDNVMTKEEIKKMKEGMDLFTKHFFALWD